MDQVTSMLRRLAPMVVAVSAVSSAAAQTGRPSAACEPTAEGMPAALLARVAAAIGAGGDGVLRVRAQGATLQPYQSDRTYPPFFSFFGGTESWFSPASGLERSTSTGGAFPGIEMPGGRFATLTSRSGQWVVRDTSVVPAPDWSNAATQRPMNPWAVIADFQRAGDVAVIGRCRYRDYPRIALAKAGPYGPDTLLIDGKTWTPVGLKRTEPHFLWGQVAVEYVWTNWDDLAQGNGRYPLTAFRMVDGDADLSSTVTEAALLPSDSAPSMAVPDTSLVLKAAGPLFVSAQPPDTVRVAANAFLLVNRFYTTGAVLLRDTVFLLDATQGEARARLDSTWIAQLFPGRHPVVLVVTDLAWPHIAGLRFWVANGATIVSHPGARAFLERVVDRRWTLEPDRLERDRRSAHFNFRPVTDSMLLAGGALKLYPIDGASSEVALMGWLPSERFLWPGDYIQNTRAPTGYAREVLAATRRVGIAPARFAAQHVRMTPWSVIDSLHRDGTPAVVDPAQVNAATLRVGPITKRIRSTRNGQSVDRGQTTQHLARVTRNGRQLLISTITFNTPGGPATDSSIADAATLVPILHAGHFPAHEMRLDFEGARVRGHYTDKGKPAGIIDHRMGARPYDSSLFDLVIAALPLADHYAARVPFYIYEQGGLVWWDVRVTGRQPVALEDGTRADAWEVTVTESGRTASRLYVSATGEREVLRSTFYFPGGETTLTQ